MTHITVDDEQAKVIRQATTGLEIRDRSGNRLGYVAHGFSAAEVALANERRQSNEKRIPTREVLQHLRSLEAK